MQGRDTEGPPDGSCDGDTEGWFDNVSEGKTDGDPEGLELGEKLAESEGICDAFTVGKDEKIFVGGVDGTNVMSIVGLELLVFDGF